MNFGRCIENAMDAQGMTGTELADAMGVSKQRISVLINQRSATIRTIEKVAKAMGLTASELLDFEKDAE